MSSTTNTTASETQTYWCYECDMSITLFLPSPATSPALCPHSHTHSLHPMDPTDDLPSLLRLLSRLANSPPPSSSVDAIPTVEIIAGMVDLDGELACAVCRDGFGVGDLAKELPCKHLYHSECILPWLALRRSCPLCRFELPPRSGSVLESTPNFTEMMMEDQDLFQFALRQMAAGHEVLIPELRPSGIRVAEDTVSLLSLTQVGEGAEIEMVEQANNVETMSSWLNWSVLELGAHGNDDSSLS